MWQYGLTFEHAVPFLTWIDKLACLRTIQITEVHVHHAWGPGHGEFHGANHLALQDEMRDYHIHTRHFADIAQHATIFPDGKIVTGRNIALPPVSATGCSDGDFDGKRPFMFELIGNFGAGFDKLEGMQLETAVQVTRYFAGKGADIKFHDRCLIDGESSLSCAGTGGGYNAFVEMVRGPAAAAAVAAAQTVSAAGAQTVSTAGAKAVFTVGARSAVVVPPVPYPGSPARKGAD